MSESFCVKENKRRSRFLHLPQLANGRLSVGPTSTPECSGYVCITGLGCMAEAGCTLTMLMMVGLFLR